MATDATPLTAKPIMTRVMRNTSQIGKRELKISSMAVENSEKTMTCLRPKRSEIKPANNNPIAKATVENDNGKLLWVGLTAKNSAKIGIIGCTQYKDENTAKPAKNRHSNIA